MLKSLPLCILWKKYILVGRSIMLLKTIPSNLPYKYQEWINLHYGPDFSKWVQFLQNEVERVVKTKEDFIICEKSFVKSLELKLIFQACYDYHENRNVLFEFQ